MQSIPSVDESTPARAPEPAVRPVPGGSALFAAVYALTIFLSAFLLFQVQPLIGKIILPWFGGTPSVWTTCMLFFQILLFGGYTYAHVLNSRLPPRVQSVVHLSLLIAGCLALPILPAESAKPTGNDQPELRIVLLLAATVGLPFFVLSSTGPLLQGWYSRTHAGRSPYRLYALSNAGSLLALVSYPFVFDLLLRTRFQAWLWSCGFAAFAALCGGCALGIAWQFTGATAAAGSAGATESADSPAPSLGTKCLWFALATVPSILLLATTNQVCLDVASVPFLWVLPLTLYLLSFILCFDSDRWYSRRIWMPSTVALLATVVPVLDSGASVRIGLQALVYFAALFLCAMVCHGELVRLKPHARHLTSFYLLISAGGAAGGVFVGIVAPHVFRNYFELHVGLFACAALMVVVLYLDRACQQSFNARARRLFRALPVWTWTALLLALTAAAAWQTQRLWGDWLSAATVVAIVALGVSLTFYAGCVGTAALALGVFGAALSYHAGREYSDVVAAKRNFYGVLRVREWPSTRKEQIEFPSMHYLSLLNGRILHGQQYVDRELRKIPTTYYRPDSGVGRILEHAVPGHPRRVGLVGLGVGTLAAYARPGDAFRFYEINAAVPLIAQRYFHYLEDCRGAWEIVPGDARLSLEREDPQHFDVLVLDAFSGDAIPVHLLTVEAFQIFLRHLNSDGVIAVHISNRHFELRPVVDAVAEHLGLTAVEIESRDKSFGGSNSSWVLVSRDPKSLSADEISKGAVPPAAARVLWTDDRSSLFQVLRERKDLLELWRRILRTLHVAPNAGGAE